MKGYKIPHLIALAAIGWIFLIVFQAKWLKDSHNMIEEQFDQKVTMAMCAAVNALDSSSHVSCGLDIAAMDLFAIEQNPSTEVPIAPTANPSEAEIKKALVESMAFYDIHLPFEIQLGNKSSSTHCDPSSPYCCTLTPFNTNHDQAQLTVFFPGKSRYIFKQMWMMLASSLFILLFILGVFVWTLRALIKQRRITRFNVDFFNNMAHEFNTPLTNIKLALTRLISKNPDLKNDPYLSIIRKEDHKLSEQVEGVLNLARVENGNYQIHKKPIQIHALLLEVVKDMKLKVNDMNASIIIDPTIQNITVNGDSFHLAHAFRNLIDNALKYCNNQPVIEIIGKEHGSGYSLIFKDNGIGISKAHKKLIFKKFQRIGNNDKHDQKGFGLGLAYVQMIMKRHKGWIDVKSDLKSGSTFELFIPTT